MKLFRIETVNVSQSFFGIFLPSVVLRNRTDKFERKFSLCSDLVKALVWTAVILPCCLCLFDFFFICVLPLCLVNKVEYRISSVSSGFVDNWRRCKAVSLIFTLDKTDGSRALAVIACIVSGWEGGCGHIKVRSFIRKQQSLYCDLRALSGRYARVKAAFTSNATHATYATQRT